MKCQKCGKKEATAHITKIVNGYKEEMHLCSDCASSSPEYKEMKSGMNFGISDFLTGMFTGGKQTAINGEREAGTCPTCHLSYDEFLKHGKLGCGDCYAAFNTKIHRPLKQIHGTFEHIGKVPKRGGSNLMIGKKISSLEAEMNAAVERQDFETAARLRDEIKALKSGTKGEEV